MSNKSDIESEEMVAPDVIATEEKPKRTKKNGDTDMRSIKSKANISKARSRARDFIKAGKELAKSDAESDSGDEVIDLVMRPKAVEIPIPPKVKAVRKPKTIVPQSLDLRRDETEEFDEAHMQALRKELENSKLESASRKQQLDDMRDSYNKEQAKANNQIDISLMRQKMILKF